MRKRKIKNGEKIKIARKRETVTKNKQTKKSMARKYTMWSLLPVVGGAAEWSLPSCSCKIEVLALPVTNSLSWMKVTIFSSSFLLKIDYFFSLDSSWILSILQKKSQSLYGWIIPRKGKHSRTSSHMSSQDCDSIHRACTGLHRWGLSPVRGSGHKHPSLRLKLSTNDNCSKGNVSFFFLTESHCYAKHT